MSYKNNTFGQNSKEDGFELEFKRHNIFFDELENTLNEIRRIGEMAMFEPKVLNLYFSKIYSLVIFYSAYLNLEKKIFWKGDISDKDNRIFKLDIIKNKLFGKSYISNLENVNNLETDYKIKLTDTQKKIFSDLNELIRDISVQLSYSELRPKPIKNKEEEYEGVEHKAVKEIIRGFKGVVER